MDQRIVWIGIALALAQTVVLRVLNYYFPEGYHRKGAVRNRKDEDEDE